MTTVILLDVEEGRSRTVLLGDARGGERYLRVTWHAESDTVVFSHWQGAVCAATTSVSSSEVSRLVELLDAAAGGAAGGAAGEGVGGGRALSIGGSHGHLSSRRADDTAVLPRTRVQAGGAGISGAYQGRE